MSTWALDLFIFGFLIVYHSDGGDGISSFTKAFWTHRLGLLLCTLRTTRTGCHSSMCSAAIWGSSFAKQLEFCWEHLGHEWSWRVMGFSEVCGKLSPTAQQHHQATSCHALVLPVLFGARGKRANGGIFTGHRWYSLVSSGVSRFFFWWSSH